MKRINVASVCNQTAARLEPTERDWGFDFVVAAELDALRIAYAYRGHPHGVKVEHMPAVNHYRVTVWNERAKPMGCDVF